MAAVRLSREWLSWATCTSRPGRADARRGQPASVNRLPLTAQAVGLVGWSGVPEAGRAF